MPSQLRTRLGRALIVGAGSLIVVVWIVLLLWAAREDGRDQERRDETQSLRR